MNDKHIGEVVQVIGPVLDIRFAHDQLPALLNAIEIDNHGVKLTAEVAQQIGDDTVRCHCHEFHRWNGKRDKSCGYWQSH